MNLKNKTILVISPQRWGKMHLSKQHYALELAKLGNKVYFLNPPHKNAAEKFKIEQGNAENVQIITYKPSFPYFIRFQLRWLYDFLVRFEIRKVIKKLGHPLDIVWSFEPNLYSNLKCFKARFTIFHPVDEVIYPYQIQTGKTADIIFSVTNEILSNFDHLKIKKVHVHHGLSNYFVKEGLKQQVYSNTNTRIGYIGNLLRPEIDTDTFESIITNHPNLIFEFWGTYNTKQSNIGGNFSNNRFIEFLKIQPNVILHGPKPPPELAKCLHQMDAFLICYDVQKDQSKGTNYHKIMEYLSTGKVIISNNVTTFSKHPELIRMVLERDNNDQLPKLFKETIDNLKEYNSPKAMQTRRDFALENTYKLQISRIEKILSQLEV